MQERAKYLLDGCYLLFEKYCKKKYLFMSKNKALSVCIVKFILTYNHQFLLLLYHTPD